MDKEHKKSIKRENSNDQHIWKDAEITNVEIHITM